MSDYLRSINKTSNASSNKDIKILNSILSYYYYFNELGDVVNTRMRMKMDNKKLNLLGNFKIIYDKNEDVFDTISFESPVMKIIIKGSFIRSADNCITYKNHREVRISVINN
jgi:hypothetical protein